MLLTGCSVEIDARNAIVRPASSTEFQNDAEAASRKPYGFGIWVLLTALLEKEDVQRISHSEVYPHVYVVECSSGKDTNVGTEPKLEGIDLGNANTVKALLKARPAKSIYQMKSLIFARKGDFETPQCLQLRGGSYLGQKIIEKRIPIQGSGPLP